MDNIIVDQMSFISFVHFISNRDTATYNLKYELNLLYILKQDLKAPVEGRIF